MHVRYSALVLLAGALSCRAPARDYDAGRIAGVTSLAELMDVQATIADRRFKLARKVQGKPLTDAQFAEFVDMGSRLQASAKRMSAFSKGPGFDKYANELAAQAAGLESAARDRNGSATAETALAIQKTCAACHDDFR